jgi:hypothetical protein
MKEFLNKTMNAERSGKSARVQRFQKDFPKTAQLPIEKLGDKPFHVRGPLNTSVLDAVFSTVLDNLNKIPRDFSARFERLIGDKDFQQATYYSTSDVVVVKARFAKAHDLLIS